MQSKAIFAELDVDLREEDGKGESPLQFSKEEDKGEIPIKKRQKI